MAERRLDTKALIKTLIKQQPELSGFFVMRDMIIYKPLHRWFATIVGNKIQIVDRRDEIIDLADPKSLDILCNRMWMAKRGYDKALKGRKKRLKEYRDCYREFPWAR